MAETARVLAAADDYFGKKGQELLDQCKAEDGYLLDRELLQSSIIQEYAVLEAFGRLAGKRKDYTSLHVEQVLSLQKKENGHYTEFPQKIRAVKEYGGVRLRKISTQQEKKHRENRRSVRFFSGNTRVTGTLESPFGIFEAKIFSYKNQKIEENKYTKWFDYDKIKNSPCVRTRRQGVFLVVNREGGKKN